METINYDLKPDLRTVKTESSDDEIYLTIKIGNGQIGGNKVSSNGNLLAKGNLTEHTYIGNNETLVNKTVEIETNILDVNTFTNRCVITTSFFNQNNIELFSSVDKGDAPENGVASFKGKYIVNFVLILFFICSLFTQKVLAQTPAKELEFDKFETPTAPGLILFDETPSSIEKPTTPQGLGLSLLGLGQNGGAIEFAPYWLIDHPDLSAKDMYTEKSTIISHFAISVATVKTDTLSFLSAGVRTRILQSYGKSISTLDVIKSEIELALSDGEIDKADSLRQKYVDILEKPVFNLDAALALGGSSMSNSFNDLELNRWAAWLTFNFRPKVEDFNFTLLTRYINNEKYKGANIQADLIDLGTRLNYDISKFTISLEYVHRMNLTSEIFNDYRLAAIAGYKLTDNLYITSTLGKNFSDVNNIIALAGINFGFSKKKVKAID